MTRKRIWISTAAAIALAAAGGVAVAAANGGGESPLGGDALDRASQAALDHTGGGTVIEAETGDGGAAYEVEVRLDDGRVVEVALGSDFTVTGQAEDDDGPAGSDDDSDGAEDD